MKICLINILGIELCYTSVFDCLIMRNYVSSGWNLLMDVCHVFTGSFHVCVEYLKEGHLVALAPGGVMEAQFGDENYHLIWGKRIGFAKVALQAQVVCFGRLHTFRILCT